MNMSSTQKSQNASVDTHSVMFITQRPELIMTEGEGSWLKDGNGKRYLDFLQGWAVNCLGHRRHHRWGSDRTHSRRRRRDPGYC